MRKQYHFRPSDDGLRAWDVDRLIGLSRDHPDEEVPLAAIVEIDENYWFTNGYQPTVRSVVEHLRLIDEADLSYAIVLDPDGRVMDGMHRVAKALCEGRATVKGKRLATWPAPDYVGVEPAALPYE